MAARSYEVTSSTAQSSTTSTSFQDKVTLTFTPDANSDYLIFWCAKKDSSVNSSTHPVRLYDDTGATVLQQDDEVVRRIGDQPCGGLTVVSFGASPASQTLKVQFASDAGVNECRIREAHLGSLKLTSDDEFVVNSANQAVTSTSFTDLEYNESDGVTIVIGEATGRGWSATAVHAGWPGESCALYHGNASAVTPATVVSQIACSKF